MKVILAIKSGISRTASAWKPVLIFWFISLILSWMIVWPLKAGLKSALGKSMIAESLIHGQNVTVLGDLGSGMHSMISSLMSGLIILALTAVILNVFITGGLFDSLKQGYEKFTPGNFFKACARSFWSFSIILGLLYLIMMVIILAVLVIPVSAAYNSDSGAEGLTFRIIRIASMVFIAVSSIMLLVADYARAWQTNQSKSMAFRAFGFGFSQTFRTFISSFPLMIIMLLLQAVVLWSVYKLVSGYAPVTGGGVFLLFVVSQVLLIIKILFKVLRFASVTSLMEQIPSRTAMPRMSGTGSDSGPENSGRQELNDVSAK